jgi:hypothetical protein
MALRQAHGGRDGPAQGRRREGTYLSSQVVGQRQGE